MLEPYHHNHPTFPCCWFFNHFYSEAPGLFAPNLLRHNLKCAWRSWIPCAQIAGDDWWMFSTQVAANWPPRNPWKIFRNLFVCHCWYLYIWGARATNVNTLGRSKNCYSRCKTQQDFDNYIELICLEPMHSNGTWEGYITPRNRNGTLSRYMRAGYKNIICQNV